MRRSLQIAYLVFVAHCVLIATNASAHPASGIVVNAKGEVFFVYTGKGVCQIDRKGKLTYIHEVNGGGHFMALDVEGKFSTQFPRLFQRITPEGVKPALLYASGGAPFVVNRDGNLYYGSGYPGGADTAPSGLTLTRLSPEGTQVLFAPSLKETLAKLNEAVTGLANGPNGTLFVACPNAILKVETDGKVTTFVHPVLVNECDEVFGKLSESDSPYFHAPYLRGLDVTEEGTIYAAVNGCRCVVRVTADRKVERVLNAEKPWSPTGVAVGGQDVFVLEYTHTDKPEGWAPRVRKLSHDGKVTVLANLAQP